MAAVPVRVHRLPPATLTDITCIANDEEWCQWAIRWPVKGQSTWRHIVKQMVERPLVPQSGPGVAHSHAQVDDISFTRTTAALPSRRHVRWLFFGGLTGLILAAWFRVMNPSVGWGEIILARSGSNTGGKHLNQSASSH